MIYWDLVLGGACFYLALIFGLLGLQPKRGYLGNIGLLLMIIACIIFYFF